MIKMFKILRKIYKNWDKFEYFIEHYDEFFKKETKSDKRYTLFGVPEYQKKYIQENILRKDN